MVSILKEKSSSPFLKDTPEGQDKTEDNEEDIEVVTEDKADKEDHTIEIIKASTAKEEAEGEEAEAEEVVVAEETLVKVDNQDLKANKDNKGRSADSTETTGADKEEAAADIETIDKDNN